MAVTSDILPRHKPDPLPAIKTTPESMATGSLKQTYEATKLAFGVPWMGVVAMAFASYPAFYTELWRHFGPVAMSKAFVRACDDIRDAAKDLVAPLDIEDLRDPLRTLGYGDADLQEIDRLIEVFSEGNIPYLLLASVARLALEGQDFEARAMMELSERPPTRPVWPAGQSLVLVQHHHQNREGRALYDRIQEILGLPFVNTDYRALARWPSYFDLAWSGLERRIGSAGHTDAVDNIHNLAVDRAAKLPGLGGLTRTALNAAALQDRNPQEVLEVVRLFQWLLPGLVVNVSVFRHQLPSA